MTSFYDLECLDNKNQPFKFSELRGKFVLIVNTASKCGFTPQYQGLEKLHQQFKDQGLVILGFPCNQFGGQEPGTNEGNVYTYIHCICIIFYFYYKEIIF